MDRRTFLTTTGAIGAAGLAGCMADADDAGDDPTETTAPGSGDDEPAIVSSSVELVDASCSSGEDSSASLSMDEETLTVSFSGQVTTSNPCHDVTLERAEYDADEERLAIVVGTEATDEACVDCVGLVQFEGTVEFENGLPGEAYVGHGDTILSGSGDEAGGPGGSEPEAVELVEESFTVTSAGNDSPTDDADVAFNPEENTVVVTGTITGSNGCTTATLGSASYDPATDSLSVDVVTTRREGSDGKVCTQALVGIGYEATFTFEGGIAHSVSVSHDGQGVAGAGFESSSERAQAPDDA